MQHGPGFGIDLMNPAATVLADPERSFRPRKTGILAIARSGIVPSTVPVAGSIFWITASAIRNRCFPSKAVPACAASSVTERLDSAGLGKRFQRSLDGAGADIECSPSLIQVADQEKGPSLIYPAWAAFARSPCASSVARAAFSISTDRPRSRETSAISALAMMHRARATGSREPKVRAAECNSSLARANSPGWAIAMPCRASAGASSRSATRFSAASGSPVASARRRGRDQPIEIPSHFGVLAMDSMVWMYLLMSLFHLSPWLKLASGEIAHLPHDQTEGDLP